MSNSWKKYGGTRKPDQQHTFTVKTLVADELLLRQKYSGVFEVLGSINVAQDIYGNGALQLFGADDNLKLDISENAMASSKSSLNIGFSNGFWNYKLSQTFDATKLEETTISAIYDDDCTRIMLSFKNTSQTISSSDSIQSLAILIQLKPFASFTVPGF